jgi:hypothetical protein
MDKTILLASFIFPERLDWFITYLENQFGIVKTKIFVFKNLDDESKLIVTFKLVIHDEKRLNLKELFPNALMIHKRGTAFYTINALNELIKLEFGYNVDPKSVKIDWAKYQDKFVLLDNKTLKILSLSRVF